MKTLLWIGVIVFGLGDRIFRRAVSSAGQAYIERRGTVGGRRDNSYANPACGGECNHGGRRIVHGGCGGTAAHHQEIGAHDQLRPACKGWSIDNDDVMEVIGTTIGAPAKRAPLPVLGK